MENCRQVFMEILAVVIPWDRGWGTDQVDPMRPLRIGIHCAKGRRRAYAKNLLAAEALRSLGFLVFTEAPCTDPCGCGSPSGRCSILTDGVGAPACRDELIYQNAQDAKLARDIAIRTSDINLAIILRYGWWGDGLDARIRRRVPHPCEEAGGKGWHASGLTRHVDDGR